MLLLILLVACVASTTSVNSLVVRGILASIVFIACCACWFCVSQQAKKREELSFYELEQMIPETVVADAEGEDWVERDSTLSFTEEDTLKLCS